jgi:hypothetical protein
MSMEQLAELATTVAEWPWSSLILSLLGLLPVVWACFKKEKPEPTTKYVHLDAKTPSKHHYGPFRAAGLEGSSQHAQAAAAAQDQDLQAQLALQQLGLGLPQQPPPPPFPGLQPPLNPYVGLTAPFLGLPDGLWGAGKKK